MTLLHQRFNMILSRIREAETAVGRATGDVQLLAVSKTKPEKDIAEIYQFGQRHFGESYCQEAMAKQKALAAYNITWHFIGPIQSNKCKQIARGFDWVHSVDRFKIARRLSEHRPRAMPPLNICLQVNISGEASKSGIDLTGLPQLIEQVRLLDNVCLRGVMAIPGPETIHERQRQPYQRLYQAVRQLDDEALDTFSFGMSGDLKAAIAEGSTIVRIGTALFGPRTD